MSSNVSPLQSTTVQPPRGDAPAVEPLQSKPGRIDSIDLLRGIVMVIMMLDHTRDFVHYAVVLFDPTDLSQTNIALFLTRWITHFCAPVFVFLAGTSIFLQFARGKSRAQLTKFLFTRGLWLIILEFTLVRLGATFNFDFRFLGFMQVIWAIGASMVVMAALIQLPVSVVGIFGVLMIFLHNLLDTRVSVEGWNGPGSPVPSIAAKLWMVLHVPFTAFPVLGWPSPVVVVVYPLIPWVGVMAAGFAFGRIYQMEAGQRRKLLLTMGAVATVLFIAIRAFNKYGDPVHWSQQNNAVLTALSFVNTTKYPPSLDFLLMTLGPAFITLAVIESVRRASHAGGPLSRFRDALITFGRVPLFFYLLQWPTAHLISLILHIAFGKSTSWLLELPIPGAPAPEGIGFDLWVVYICWIAGVIILYPLCKWFAGVKQRRRDWWLSYL